MLAGLVKGGVRLADPESKRSIQPDYAQNEPRSIKPEYLVVVGICTHLGCTPTPYLQLGDPAVGPAWPGGFWCPCHGSRFDLAARVFANMPAPTNLTVPPHRYVADARIRIGEEPAWRRSWQHSGRS
jgi:ubiquinol-cytochrome c reductase iron-sulfur subunit